MPQNTSHRWRITSVCVTSVALTFALSSCSNEEEKREYATPQKLCGTAVDADALEPFLPPGRKVSMSDSDGSGIKSCDMVVDKTLAVTTTQAWIEEGKDTAYFAAGLTLEKLEHSDDDGQIRYTGNEAFGKTRTCVDKKQELYVAVQAQGSKHRDSDAMKQLIEAYINEVQRSDECKDGAP